LNTLVKLLMLLTLGEVICLPGMALAYTINTGTFQTSYNPNAVYLFMDGTATMTIQNFLPASWTISEETPNEIIITGPNAGKGQVFFDLTFTADSLPVSCQWAEVQWPRFTKVIRFWEAVPSFTPLSAGLIPSPITGLTQLSRTNLTLSPVPPCPPPCSSWAQDCWG